MRLALTFDDGPDPRWTPRVLDALRRHEIPATFFVIAPRALSHPQLIARMRAEGHSVQLHCDEHVRHSTRDRAWVAVDTDRALCRLESLGVHPTLWRTPWGDLAPFTARLADERGLTLTGWSADTHDWRGDTAEEMLAAIASQLDDNGIVLAHDALGPGALRSGCAETVRLIELLARRMPGARFVTLGNRPTRPEPLAA